MMRKSLCMISRPSISSPLWTYGRLRLRRVDQHRVGVAPPRHLQRGPGAHGDRLHRDAGLPLEHGQQGVEQAGVLGAGRGRQDDLAALALGRRAMERKASQRPDRIARSGTSVVMGPSEDDLGLGQAETLADAWVAHLAGDVLEGEPGGPAPGKQIDARRSSARFFSGRRQHCRRDRTTRT